MSLARLDYVVIAVYLVGMLALGVCWARRRDTDEDYFLVGRRMPWLAVGISIVASMLSSITYLAEPGEVWKSGVTHVMGKMVGIAIETLLVWSIFIPFMMRFRFTSAYEYLEHRFGRSSRRVGAALFVVLIVLWMGFVVLVLSQVVHQLSGIPLWGIVFTVGIVATFYTVLGGLRVVIWTDVLQVALLAAGGVVTIAYIAYTTGTWLPDWLAATRQYVIATGQPTAIPLFSWDPTLRATVVTVAVNMAVWHICIHSSNQMTLQRYFSTRSMAAARRSFLASAVVNVAVSLMLVCVGLSVVYYYTQAGVSVDGHLDPARQRDLIFPTFAMHHLPIGCAGALVTALLAAAMSSVDSGLNSIATVVALELRPRSGPTEYPPPFMNPSLRPSPAVDSEIGLAAAPPATKFGNVPSTGPSGSADTSHVLIARLITLLAGVLITMTAYILTFLPSHWGIIGAIPRTFNAITGPLGGMFLVGIFLPSVRQRAMLTATTLGLLASIFMGYLHQIGLLLEKGNWIGTAWPELSYTWIMPCSLVVTCVCAPLLVWLDRAPQRDLSGLTWSTRHCVTHFTEPFPRKESS